MKTSGWLFLILSWGLIIFLSVFSFYKILTGNKGDGPESATPQRSE
jgi:hypothetical protein